MKETHRVQSIVSALFQGQRSRHEAVALSCGAWILSNLIIQVSQYLQQPPGNGFFSKDGRLLWAGDSELVAKADRAALK